MWHLPCFLSGEVYRLGSPIMAAQPEPLWLGLTLLPALIFFFLHNDKKSFFLLLSLLAFSGPYSPWKRGVFMKWKISIRQRLKKNKKSLTWSWKEQNSCSSRVVYCVVITATFILSPAASEPTKHVDSDRLCSLCQSSQPSQTLLSSFF